MIVGFKPVFFLILFLVATKKDVIGKESLHSHMDGPFKQDSTEIDSLNFLKKLNAINKKSMTGDSVNMVFLETKPHVSTQLAIKGMIAGVLVNENTGEPGVKQDLLIRGLKQPILYKSDAFNQQPLYIMDGVPLIGDHPFVSDVKKYDNVSIGPGTNQFANSDMDNISSIEVIKDPATLAKYGALGSNGVILITSKKPAVGARSISINSFFGTTAKESVTPVNGDYENRFRSQFYNRYADQDMKLNYAGYLRDSTNTDYYGQTNWHDLYYQQAFMHNVNLSITGGSERANFRFYGGVNSLPGGADDTKLDRYNGVFNINMVPFDWFTVSSMVNVTKMDRNRNRTFRDRFNETAYLPDITAPIAPGGNIYGNFLKEYDKVIDDNINNMVKGYVSLLFEPFENFSYTSQFSFDYNQSLRDVFYPTTLMETINFVSNYFGYNQRFNLTNKVNYKYDINEKNQFKFDVGHIYWADKHRYNYSTAYDGPSDFIKINVVQGNAGLGGYLTPVGFMTYRYTDNLEHRMSSFYGNVNYQYSDLLELALTLRHDGSSNRMPDKRWYLNKGASAKINALSFAKLGDNVNRFDIGLSYSRVGETFLTDQYAYGPQFRTDLGWEEEPAIISYNGFATVSRPYTAGWVSYDINTPYSDKFNASLGTTLFNNRLDFDLSVYTNTTKDMALLTTVAQEYGYKGKVSSGMSVNNKGAEVQLSIVPVKSSSMDWRSSFVLSYNQNTLKSLPNNLQSTIIGNRKLVVGESISKFWLLENQGIINNSSEIPTTAGETMTVNAIELQVGDPLWKDQDGDNNISNNDKVLKGNMIAPFMAGWNNTFKYKNWNLDIAAIAHLGNDILNESTANYYDFINNEQSSNINSIKEIFHWQQSHEIDQYPFYNPWSPVAPFRKDQDLFLEDGSFFKIRNVTLGYDLTNTLRLKGKTLKRVYVYGTASNLLTITKFSGTDPEFVNLSGRYDGYGMPLAKSFIVGFKLDL